jgi:hypothetical protein
MISFRTSLDKLPDFNKTAPDLDLRQNLATSIGFNGGYTNLGFFVAFRWRKTEISRNILIENHDI